ncbi:MAG: adenine phosphoribosyltransferase [Acidobacteria bacterium]|nr:MAG: adenine phosphoribosyltransferase [Acidobacteriota bacterium]
MSVDDLKRYVRDVPDFPKPGILFRDITPLLADPAAFGAALERLAREAEALSPDLVAGIESRGFILGAPLARQLGTGFVPIRKPGKLPSRTLQESYSLEYGEGRLEMHADAVGPGRRVLIVDDLLATGGTAAAACRLVRRAGGEVAGLLFLIELEALAGRSRLEDGPVVSLLRY